MDVERSKNKACQLSHAYVECDAAISCDSTHGFWNLHGECFCQARVISPADYHFEHVGNKCPKGGPVGHKRFASSNSDLEMMQAQAPRAQFMEASRFGDA